MSRTVPENLRLAADVFEQRNKVYGSLYKRHGDVMIALFPKGIVLETADDFNRFGIFNMIVSKIGRYANNIADGHSDSLTDLSVYANMLLEIDEEKYEDDSV